MIQKILTHTAIKHPKLVLFIGAIITLIFLSAFPKLKTDTDPVHMLPQNNHAVLLYNQLKKEFNINDMVALGIESRDGGSLFTKETLTRIANITRDILQLKDQDGSEIIVKRDVVSLSTVDDIVKNERNELLVTPLMPTSPQSDNEAHEILKKLNDNPMLGGKMNAKDGSLIGIFLPLVEGKKDRSYYLSKKIKAIATKYLDPQKEKYYFAGLPVAEATFGSEMFIQMGVYAPMAGLVIFLLMLFFFRSFKIVIAPMILGVMSVIWAMGALIYSGNVIHIMSSMIPIFLLPISVLNSIHILSKLSDRLKLFDKKEDAIADVMKELFHPMLYTSLTTIVGFISLSTTGIPPVIVFGITIGLGVFIAWALSMIFIPAFTMLLDEKSLAAFRSPKKKSMVVEFVQSFKAWAFKYPKTIIAIALLITFISYIGIQKIIINDNPVRWFKANHPLRIADSAMNNKLAGTYMANLYFSIPKELRQTTTIADDFSDEEEISAPSVREPLVINYIAKIGDHLKTITDQQGKFLIGDVTSIVDVLKKVGKVAFNNTELPDSKEKVSQYIFLFESGDIKKGKDLWKIITPQESPTTQMWVYFKSGDNQNMSRTMDSLAEFMKENPPPRFTDSQGQSYPLQVNWSGLVHINNVWQAEMVAGMFKSLAGSFAIVLVMMIFLFRSLRWGIIAMLPLTITIMFIYGLIGYTGKFYDMPIAVLSSLTLGLSIDFAIHFIEHTRLFFSRHHNFQQTFDEMFTGTAQAIWRNVLVISVGFAPLFFAGLVPYLTVGMFFFLIMITSGITTLILMPAILKQFHRYLLK